MTNPDIPFTLTAYLQQGAVLNQRYGLTLDGLLTHIIRGNHALGHPGSLLDGGLGVDHPQEWELPLAQCHYADPDWHWLTTSAQPIDHDGNPIQPGPPDTHRLLIKLDEKRAGRIAVKIPKEAGGVRGRYRQRITPILVTPAAALTWQAVGDPTTVYSLLHHTHSIGGRRGIGEGTVLRWDITEHPDEDPFLFAHTHPNGTLARPCPLPCAEHANATNWTEGTAGLRPPLFHASMQRTLAIPNP